MKMKTLLSLLTIITIFNANGQIVHDENVVIQPSNYGPKLILNDANIQNKVPIEFRSNKGSADSLS